MPYCPMCGSGVSEEDMHCSRCGYSLKEETRPLPQFGKPTPTVKAVISPTPFPRPKKAMWTRSAAISIAVAVFSMIIGWEVLAIIFYPIAIVCGLYVALTQKKNTFARFIGAVLAFVSFGVLILFLIFTVEVPITLPLSQAVSPGTIQLFLASVASISAVVAWFVRRRRRGRVRTFLAKIESVYARRDEVELYKLKDMVLEALKEGKIDEGNYMILQERIDGHMKELREQRVPRCAECGRELSPRDKFCPFCGASVAH